MKRIITILMTLKKDMILLYHALLDNNTPTTLRLAIIGIILYVLSPIDIIPDSIPFFGQIDDIAIVIFVSNRIITQLEKKKPSANQKRIVRPITNIK